MSNDIRCQPCDSEECSWLCQGPTEEGVGLSTSLAVFVGLEYIDVSECEMPTDEDLMDYYDTETAWNKIFKEM